ncbi:hypothetical protein MJ560_03050 [Klebsiella pneumoniae]|nr:hypothetical protein MJ560_03050 [Klebsiella pneumoniae]
MKLERYLTDRFVPAEKVLNPILAHLKENIFPASWLQWLWPGENNAGRG